MKKLTKLDGLSIAHQYSSLGNHSKHKGRITVQCLSSKHTFFYKFIFIFIWIAGFGLGAREVLFFSVEFDLRWLQYAVIWGAGTIYIFFTTGSVKTITMDRKKKTLLVSNYLTSHSINLEEIEDIDGSSFSAPNLSGLV